MNIKVRSIDINYANGDTETIEDILVRYDSEHVDGEYLNGAIKITEEEYNQNSETLQSLSAVVKDKLSKRLLV